MYSRIAPRSRLLAADLSEAVKSDPEARIGELIVYIEEHAETERKKVRYAHDWITQNIAYGVIAHGKSVCAGNANAFKMLLDRLGIENRLLNGYARGGSFQPFEEAQRKPEDTNHAWTAVRLEGVLEKRERITLSFRGSEDAQFYIRADGDYIRIPYDTVSGRYEMETPPVSEELYLAVSHGGGYRYLAKYVVE